LGSCASLPSFPTRRSSDLLFFLILAILAGIYAFISMGRAEDPSFTVRALVVQVFWPGATPDEMQSQVVDRLEKRLQEVEHLYKVETTIRPGQASLIVEFQEYTRQDQVPDLFYQVRKRMQDEAGKLPTGVIGPVVNDDFGDVYFSLMALSAPGLPMRELTRELEPIRDRAMQLPGVRKALILGERSERVFIEFDNARLTNLGISPQAIFAAIDAHNRLLPAGHIETQGPRLYLRLDTNLAQLEELAAVPIQIGNHLLKLSDIATIKQGYEDPPSYLVRSRGEDSVLLGIVMETGANGLDLGEHLSQFVEQERKALPLGMSLEVLTNQAEAISAA